MDGIGNRRTFSLKRYGPATSIKSDTSYDVAVERVLSLASTTPSGGSELIRNPTRERLAQMANRRASFAFPPKDLISGNIRDGLSGRLHTMKGPVIEQMAVHYLFFLIILVVAHFTSWAPEIRFYTSFGYFILAACAFQISRLIYTKSPKSILPFYISIIVSSYLNVISREAHMLVSVLWYASFTIILLQSGNDRLHRHLILFSVAYAAFYFISLTIMVNIYALKCVSMVCGAGLKKPINWAHEGILIAGCTTILASFLMLERFIKESAKILIERDNNYKNLYMINMDLKRKLRLAKKGKDNKTVDLDSPLQKALDILKEQQVKLEVEKPDGWNVEVEKLEVALTILSSGQLYDPSLPQRDTDADIHDWLLNNGILKSQQHAPGSHSKAAATFSNKSHASFPTRSSLAIYNPTPRRRQSNYSVPAIRTSSEGSHSTGVNIKISNHSLNNFPYSGPISIEFEALHMLQNVDCADFDILALDRVTHGRSLFFTMSYLFKEYDFFEKFRVNEAKFARFVTKLEAGYKSNPYHNAIHAADVTQVMHVFINTHRMHSFLSLEDKFACIIAAAIHDYAHPGVNNFLVSTVNPLALRYNDQAVLENFHCSSAFELMQSEDCDILASLEPEKRKHVRELIVSMVLATDMAQHFDWLNKFKNKVQTGTFNYENKADKKLVMNIAIKCADINNPTKPASQCQKWTDMIMDEFYKQGDEEKKRNLPVSMFMNRDTPDTAKCQIVRIYHKRACSF